MVLVHNKRVVTTAVTQQCYGLHFASRRLKNNKRAVTIAILLTYNGFSLELVSNELKNSKRIVVAAVT